MKGSPALLDALSPPLAATWISQFRRTAAANAILRRLLGTRCTRAERFTLSAVGEVGQPSLFCLEPLSSNVLDSAFARPEGSGMSTWSERPHPADAEWIVANGLLLDGAHLRDEVTH